MKVFRQFDNTTNILEIIESSTTQTGYTFKTCRYKLNQKGCYVKINCNTCNICKHTNVPFQMTSDAFTEAIVVFILS